MRSLSTKCNFCGRSFKRPLRQINEARKFGWKSYCSAECLRLSRKKAKKYVCANQECGKIFERKPSELKKSKKFYCSHRCAAIVNNQEYPKNVGILKNCAFCGNGFKSREKYCSRPCKDRGQTVSRGEILSYIKEFFGKNGRIPFKNEYIHAHAARARFGSWNSAIKTAGFDPNPVMFANKHVAKDGHACDSLAEKIIDDWFYKRRINHERNVGYPGNDRLRVDFKVGNCWIEFFGLKGQHKRYDELMKMKLKLSRDQKLKLISLFPDDLPSFSGAITISNFLAKKNEK